MKPLQPDPRSQREADWAGQVRGHLEAGTNALPQHVRERLRASRQRAIDMHKGLLAPQRALVIQQADGSLRLSRWASPLAQSLLAGTLMVILLIGLLSLYQQRSERKLRDQLDIDSALLMGDLPPAAYLDPGFAQFLKAQNRATP